jgi:hypothetical protein
MGAWRVIAVLWLIACGSQQNTSGTPLDAGVLPVPDVLRCELADFSCPAGGTCCGKLCCTINQSCCLVNGQPTCVLPTGVTTDPCAGIRFGP